MRNFFILAFLLFLSLQASAQFKVLDRGPVFEEPIEGFARIISQKNGSSVFVHIDKDNKVNFRSYTPQHKMQINKKLVIKGVSKLEGLKVSGIFDISGNVMLLLEGKNDDADNEQLLRILIKPETGDIVKQDTVAQSETISNGKRLAAAFGGIAGYVCYAEKDKETDHYAIAVFNTYTADRNKRIEIIHYDSTHKEINRAFVASPEDKFKYLVYMGMTVFGDKQINLVTNAYNTTSSGGDENAIYSGILRAGSTQVEMKELQNSGNKSILGAVLRFSNTTKELLVMTVTELSNSEAKKILKDSEFQKYKKGNGYVSIRLFRLNPFNNNEMGMVDLNMAPFLAKLKAFYDVEKINGTGFPQDMQINDDGTITIVNEERYTSASSRSVHYFLGFITVLTYNADGSYKSGIYIPKDQELFTKMMSATVPMPPIMYVAKRANTATWLNVGNQYKSFAYFGKGGNNYVLMNDVYENEERVQAKKNNIMIRGVGECDGFSFSTNSESVIPHRKYVFGKPSEKKDHYLGLFTISDYNSEKNEYVTLQLVKGEKEGVRLVWLQPE